MKEEDTVVGAAGSLPGDMHKLWRTENGSQYHMEYGYSCMGYEIAGGLGIKMAKEKGDVFVMVGDGSYLMMNSEIVTAVQEGQKLIIILINNHGFGSINNLSLSLGSEGFGNQYKAREESTAITPVKKFMWIIVSMPDQWVLMQLKFKPEMNLIML